jgi:hypothetical protein
MNEEEILLELEARNGWEYNHLKAIEELAELLEALIKRVTKKGGMKDPGERHVIEEIGDVKLRLRILEYIYDAQLVRERELEKLKKFENSILTNKYKHI